MLHLSSLSACRLLPWLPAADDSALVPVLSADLASAEAAFEAALRCQSRPNGPQLQTFDGMQQSEVLYALHRVAHAI